MRCPQCSEAIVPDADGVTRFYRGLCRACAQPAKSEVPTREVGPAAAVISHSRLYRMQL